jgi:hypothetical protein
MRVIWVLFLCAACGKGDSRSDQPPAPSGKAEALPSGDLTSAIASSMRDEEVVYCTELYAALGVTEILCTRGGRQCNADREHMLSGKTFGAASPCGPWNDTAYCLEHEGEVVCMVDEKSCADLRKEAFDDKPGAPPCTKVEPSDSKEHYTTPAFCDAVWTVKDFEWIIGHEMPRWERRPVRLPSGVRRCALIGNEIPYEDAREEVTLWVDCTENRHTEMAKFITDNDTKPFEKKGAVTLGENTRQARLPASKVPCVIRVEVKWVADKVERLAGLADLRLTPEVLAAAEPK